MASRIAAGAVGAALGFGAITLVALEGGEVVVVRTRAPAGTARETRTWIADDGGAAWLEAASPTRPFFQDLETRPEFELRRDGRWLRCRVEVMPNPEGHERIRRLLRERYGWKDRWIGLVADTRASVALRLTCEDA